MGLLLSILVVCVGVLEVIASIRHIQDGYLPVWTPHHAATTSGLRSLHEHWRKKTNEEVGDNNKRVSCSDDDVTSQPSKTLLQSSGVSIVSSSATTTTDNVLVEHGRNLTIAAEGGEAPLLPRDNWKEDCRSSVVVDNEVEVPVEGVEQNEHVTEVSAEECASPTRSKYNEEAEICWQDGSLPVSTDVSTELISGIQEADGSTSHVATCFNEATSPLQDAHKSSVGDENVNRQLPVDVVINEEAVVQSPDVTEEGEGNLDRAPSPKATITDDVWPGHVEIESKTEEEAEETKSEDSLTPSGSCEEVLDEDRVDGAKSEGSLTPSESCPEVPEASKDSGVVEAVSDTKVQEEFPCAEVRTLLREASKPSKLETEVEPQEIHDKPLSPFDEDVQKLRSLLREESKPSKLVEADIESQEIHDKPLSPFDEDVQKLRSLLREDSKPSKLVEAEVEPQEIHEKPLSQFGEDVQKLQTLLREDSKPSKLVETEVKPKEIHGKPLVGDVDSKEEDEPSSEEEEDDLRMTILTPKPVPSLPIMSPGTPRKSRAADISWPTFSPTTPVIKRPSIPLITSESMSIDQPRFTHRHSDGDAGVSLQALSGITQLSSQFGEKGLPEASKDDDRTNLPYKSSADREEPCKDLESVQPSRQDPGGPVCKEELPVLSKGFTEYPTKSSIKEKFRHRETSDDVSSFSRSQEEDNEASISGDSFDVDGSEVSSSDISVKNEFSRKEMGIRRRRSYRKKRQTSSTESLPRSEEEAEDKSFSEDKTSKFAVPSKEPRRQFHKPSKASSLDYASSPDLSERRTARKQHSSFDDQEETEDIRRRSIAGDDDVFEEDVETEESESISNPLVDVKTGTKSSGVQGANLEKNVKSTEAVSTKSEPKACGKVVGQRKEPVECERISPVVSERRVDQDRVEDEEDSTVSDSSSVSQPKSAPNEAFWVSSQAEPVPKE